MLNKPRLFARRWPDFIYLPVQQNWVTIVAGYTYELWLIYTILELSIFTFFNYLRIRRTFRSPTWTFWFLWKKKTKCLCDFIEFCKCSCYVKDQYKLGEKSWAVFLLLGSILQNRVIHVYFFNTHCLAPIAVILLLFGLCLGAISPPFLRFAASKPVWQSDNYHERDERLFFYFVSI